MALAVTPEAAAILAERGYVALHPAPADVLVDIDETSPRLRRGPRPIPHRRAAAAYQHVEDEQPARPERLRDATEERREARTRCGAGVAEHFAERRHGIAARNRDRIERTALERCRRSHLPPETNHRGRPTNALHRVPAPR